MKPNFKRFAVFLFVIMCCVILPRQVEAQQSTISLQVFYDELSPYGQWIDYQDYGYVWIPNAESDFAPYSTNGHWLLTEYGWSWASDYDWGWAAFHYGRWSFNNSFGWFWVPDSEWGPAWVNWRQSDSYYGWSPMEPGISLNNSFGRAYNSNNDHWLFVRDRDIERSDINRYYVGQSDRNRIIKNSTTIRRTYVDRNRNTTYVVGPSRESIQKATGRTITPLTVRENNKPGQSVRNGQLEIYRPRIEKEIGGKKASPTHVTNPTDVKRNMSNRPAIQPVEQNKAATPTNHNRNIQNDKPARTSPGELNRPIRQPNKADIQNNEPNQKWNMNPQYNNRQERNINQPVNHDRNIQTVPPAVTQPARQENKNTVTNQSQNSGQQNIPRTATEDRQDIQKSGSNQQPNAAGRSTNAANTAQPVRQQNVRENNNKPVKEEKSVNQRVKEEQAKTPDQETNKR